ncbi:MAG: NAD(P)/FAD-dependent oxidoreductase [Gammaproteobacteria bacterium]
MRIGIIGGGLMGMAIAARVAAAGHRTVLFERAPQPGGLATWHDFGAFIWDRFYHVILPSDSELIGFIGELGLGGELRWTPTQTGYYVDRNFYSLSTNVDFLKFPPLSPWDKVRLAATILYCSRINDWKRLEQVTVEDFLVRTCGRPTFEKFWKPLLLAKLGVNYKRVSAVFIWSYIKRLFSARDAAAQKEHLGYVSGGYRRVFRAVESKIAAAVGEIRLRAVVEGVRPRGARGMEVRVDGTTEAFDKVVFTGPTNVLRDCADPALVELPAGGRDVEYLGVVCMALVTRRPFTPYYILNIGDEAVPFTGVIGMSTVIDAGQTAGLHLTYLPKYVLSTDPLLGASDEEIQRSFLPALATMYPELEDGDIEGVHINRAVKVQPLQVLGYSSLVQPTRTRHPDFYVVNTAQFVNNTLNNNEVIRNVNRFFRDCGRDFEPETSRA